MTKKEAIAILKSKMDGNIDTSYEWAETVRMAIEALQTDLVRCKDCKHREHCHETIAHTKEHDGFREHWSEPIEWCSRGERKGDGDTTKESE